MVELKFVVTAEETLSRNDREWKETRPLAIFNDEDRATDYMDAYARAYATIRRRTAAVVSGLAYGLDTTDRWSVSWVNDSSVMVGDPVAGTLLVLEVHLADYLPSLSELPEVTHA